MYKSIVTGAHGFIGSHLVKRLEQEGHEIIKIPYQQLDSFHYLKGLCEQINPNYIFHLASYGNMSGQNDDDETVMANIVRTWTLLKATKEANYKMFIHVSTSSVYGKTSKAMHEQDTIRPMTLYAATKASAEYLCRAFRKKYKKMIVSVRPFSVYGPGEAKHRFIPTLINNAIDGKPSTVIQGQHDWIYIDDFINALTTLLKKRDSLTNRLYNVGTGVMYSNVEVAQELSKIIPLSYERSSEWKVQDSTFWKADTKRISNIGWLPQVTLPEGLQKTVKYYRKSV